MSKYKAQIKQLHAQGYTNSQIAKEVGCVKSMVTYHLDSTQRNKLLKRQYKRRHTQHPYQTKMEAFKHRQCDRSSNLNYTLQNIINKLGEQPTCYLTGTPINIYNSQSYQFDHIIPISRGGDNSLNNLNICITAANQAKGNMTNDEFRSLCKQVVNHQ